MTIELFLGGVIMQFCKECGTKLKEGARFCPECGTSFGETTTDHHKGSTQDITTQSSTLNKPAENPFKKMTKKQKIMSSILVVAALLFFITYQVGSNLTSKESAIENLQEAIVKKDKDVLSKLLVSSDPRISLDKKSIDSFLGYINQNPAYLPALISGLERQADTLEEQEHEKAKTVSAIESNLEEYGGLLALKKSGKTALIFDKYRFHVQPFYINISTNYKDAKIYLNNKEIAKADSDDFNGEFGPYAPGEYTVKTEYKGDYATMSNEQKVNSYQNGGYIHVDLELEAMYVNADSNFSDAAIYVNGKDSGITADDFSDFGPVNPGVSLQAVKSFPWGEVKSEEVKVESGHSYYDLALNTNTADYFDSITDTIKEFQQSKSESLIALDSSKLLHSTEEYKTELNESIENLKENGYQYIGEGLNSITIDLDYSDIEFGEDTYHTTARYVSTFTGDWVYSSEPTEEDIADAKKETDTVYNYIDLVYDPESETWLVSSHSEDSWSFDIENGNEITF